MAQEIAKHALAAFAALFIVGAIIGSVPVLIVAGAAAAVFFAAIITAVVQGIRAENRRTRP